MSKLEVIPTPCYPPVEKLPATRGPYVIFDLETTGLGKLFCLGMPVNQIAHLSQSLFMQHFPKILPCTVSDLCILV